MEQQYGLTAELYRAVVALVDDRMKEIRVTRQDFDRLQAAVERLTEAHARAEERLTRLEAAVERLAEAQARTEARLEELAQAQARTEERLTRLEAAVERLAEAQARTEARLEELARAQARTEERLNRLEAVVERLAEAQARTEERLTRLEAVVEQLAEAQKRTEERVDRLEQVIQELAEAQKRTEAQLQNLIQVVASVKGRQLELTYQERAWAYFGPLLRRLRVLSPVEIEDELESHLSPEEFRDLLNIDLLVSGQPRHVAEAPQVWLAVEVSGVVDRHDVERALRRASLLRRAGLCAIPTVAGEDATLGAREEAEAHKVLMLQDGRVFFWNEALADALGQPVFS